MTSDQFTTLPDATTLAKAFSVQVLDKAGAKVSLGSIIGEEKTLVVFIRNFFCGRCQDYVSLLSQVPASSYKEAGIKLVVIGCGDWGLLNKYIDITEFHGSIYANPGRELYRIFDMVDKTGFTPAGEEKKKYVSNGAGLAKNAILSTFRAMRYFATQVGKQGSISQQGGEFIFGPGQTCSFASRMRHSEDHVDVDELMKAAGVTVMVPS